MSDKVYRLRPLVWEQHASRWGIEYVATTPIEGICVWLGRDEWIVIFGGRVHRHPTLEAAQAAAASWFRERIEAALEEIQHKEIKQ